MAADGEVGGWKSPPHGPGGPTLHRGGAPPVERPSPQLSLVWPAPSSPPTAGPGRAANHILLRRGPA
eukprot:5164967-Pyramimonas_sp.AAC.1